MNEQEIMAEFFTRILTFRNQMNNYGKKMEDVMIIDKSMRTLTPRFDHIVVAIEQGTNLKRIKVEKVQGTLKAQELKLDERNSLKCSD